MNPSDVQDFGPASLLLVQAVFVLAEIALAAGLLLPRLRRRMSRQAQSAALGAALLLVPVAFCAAGGLLTRTAVHEVVRPALAAIATAVPDR